MLGGWLVDRLKFIVLRAGQGRPVVRCEALTFSKRFGIGSQCATYAEALRDSHYVCKTHLRSAVIVYVDADPVSLKPKEFSDALHLVLEICALHPGLAREVSHQLVEQLYDAT